MKGVQPPWPVAVSKSVALAGTVLRTCRKECHRKHGDRRSGLNVSPDLRVLLLSVSDAPKGGAYSNQCSLNAQFCQVCGEGACSRSAAKRSSIRLTRFTLTNRSGRFWDCFARARTGPREQAPSPQGLPEFSLNTPPHSPPIHRAMSLYICRACRRRYHAWCGSPDPGR